MKELSREDGFTVIEIVIFFVILAVLAGFFILQKMDLETSFADQERKTAINAIYYNLTEIYHAEHGYYPANIENANLAGIDPDIMYDSWGIMIGESDSEYRYEGLNCNNDGQCQEFRLTAELEKEDNYVIESDN